MAATRSRPPRLQPAIATAWLLAAGLAYLAPALLHGTKLGDYDLLSVFGLGQVPGVVPHNIVSSDQIQEMAPWAALSWEQIHHGHLPLWDPYSAMGLPLAFNLQSAPFGLPSLVGLLVPVRFAYTVAVYVKMVIAGTGALALSRVLGLGWLAGALAGTVFELSGAFTAWLGWPQAGVFCWLGWLLAATLILLGRTSGRDSDRFPPTRSGTRHPRGATALFSISLAFAALGGHPESLAISILVIVVFAAVIVGGDAARTRDWSAAVRGVGRLGFAAALGLGLAAPILLPGAQVVEQSLHRSVAGSGGMPASRVVNLVFAGFYGNPTHNGSYFDRQVSYYSSAAYVGLIAVVLAAVAVVVHWKRIEVVGLAVLGAGLGAIAYLSPVTRFMLSLPAGSLVIWYRVLIPLGLVLAVLAAVGLQTVISSDADRRARMTFDAAVGGGVVFVAAMAIRSWAEHLPGGDGTARAHSLIAASLDAVVLSVAVLVLRAGTRRRGGAHRVPRRRDRDVPDASRQVGARLAVTAAVLLIAGETAFLATAEPGLWDSSRTFFAATPAEVDLEHLVGSGRVGFFECATTSLMPQLGILPEANSAYGVSELSAYDPTIPASYLKSPLLKETGTPLAPSFGQFCPSITSATIARQYGVSYILAASGQGRPAGTTLVARLGGENLFSVPDSGLVTMTVAGAPGVVVAPPAAETDPRRITVRIDTTRPAHLYIHVTDSPGWSARLGRAQVALHPYEDAEMQAGIGPADTTLVLTYWPSALTWGLWIAAAAALLLTLQAVPGRVLSARRRRGRPGRPTGRGGGPGPGGDPYEAEASPLSPKAPSNEASSKLTPLEVS